MFEYSHLSSTYFQSLFNKVNTKEYGEATGKPHTHAVLYIDPHKKKDQTFILHQLKMKGFCLVRLKENLSLNDLSCWQSQFLGSLVNDKNPKKLPYSRIRIKPGSAYFADSHKAQPLHTDEGYTIHVPRTISLFCEEPSNKGGINTLIDVDQIVKAFYNSIFNNKYAFDKNSMWVESAHEKITKPLFFYYQKNKTGMAYSPITKEIKLPKSLYDLFINITDYIHTPYNQTRIKLEKGDLLILDNFRILHGRTRFDELSSRSVYRFWFSLKNILNLDK